ncbi:MAG TPA: DUF4350 domain-containing protein [Jatrophihabitantaceae bacterium]|jgi:hypothetical protein|nr:DUF4350 domain-containing protein [Jatrophihabitantaceae bacterium]
MTTARPVALPAVTPAVGVPDPAGESIRPPAPGRALWRRARFWLALALLIGLAALGIIQLQQPDAAQLDPKSAAPGGSRALAVLLAARGTQVRSVSSVDAALESAPGSTVLIPFPDDYDTTELRRLATTGRRLVVLAPNPTSLATLAPGRALIDVTGASDEPACAWPGALAAGAVAFPAPSAGYSGIGACYGGQIVVTPRLVLIGSGGLLANQNLDDHGVAALAVNAVSGDGDAGSISWLRPGADATAGQAPATVWDLFPNWIEHAVWWLLAAGALVALWRGRRLGPPVLEPLPVVVRSAEVVEGHGRLYRRAGARGKAASALRSATVTRLAIRLGLPGDADATQVGTALAAATGRRTDDVAGLLGDGPAPPDDSGLVRLGRCLADLELTDLTSTSPASSGASQPKEIPDRE